MVRIGKAAWRSALLGVVVAGLAACGGGDSRPPPVTQVYVMGDSLADVGTIGGVKFTVVDPSAPTAATVFPQQVANRVGLNGSAQCNFYAFAGGTFTANSQAGCTNYAIGGGRIDYVGAPAADPRNVPVQLATRAKAGTYASTDLVLIDGGGNDLADVVKAYLGAASDGGAALNTFLSRRLTAEQRTAAGSIEQQVGLHMQALADYFFAAIKTSVLDAGASRVVVLNIPDITLTPDFAAVLGTIPEPQKTAIQGLIRQWAGAFNARLSALAQTQTAVAVVDFFTVFTQTVTTPPASYGLSNSKDPVCTVDTGTALGKFPCLSSVLEAGRTEGWWKSHVFADGFHPTPASHQVMADVIYSAIVAKGWQ